MARLVKAACPQCGAGVRLDPAQDWVTCGYCRTSSFIRRAEHAPGPATPAAGPHPVIDLAQAARAGKRTAMLSWVLTGIVVVVAIFVPMIIRAVSASHPGALPGLAAIESLVFADRTMLGDVTGDGTLDPILTTWVHGSSKPAKHLVALDAHTGKVVWKSDPIASDESLTLGSIGQTTLVAKPASLHGYDLRTGKQLWERALPEKVSQFCDDGNGGAAFVAKDEQVYAVELLTGQLSAKGKLRVRYSPPHTRSEITRYPKAVRERFEREIVEWERARASEVICQPASSPEYASRGRGVSRQRQQEPKIEGMSVSEVWREREQGPLLVIGSRQPGSRIPMIAAVGPDDRLLWKAELPAKNPMGAEEGEPATFTLGHGRAVAAYHQKSDKQLLVSAWDLQNGQRYWEAGIATDDVRHPSISISDRHVFVRNGGKLEVFALSDGRMLWSFGK